MESGTRLQLVQFVHALQYLTDAMVRMGAWEVRGMT